MALDYTLADPCPLPSLQQLLEMLMGILWEGIPIIISIIAFSAYAAAGTMQSCPFSSSATA